MDNASPLIINAAIVAYNRPKSITALIQSLLNQTYSVNKIVVIDNSTSSEVESAICENQLPVVFIKMEANVGSAGGFYNAIKNSYLGSDYVWIFDDDMNINKDALFELVRHIPELDRDSRLGAARCWYKGNNENKPKLVKDFAWRGTLIKSSIINEIGLPDPDYFLYGEDVDYSLRISKAFYRIYYVPTSIMWVNSSPTKQRLRVFGKTIKFHQSPFRLYYASRNEIILNRKHRNIKGLARTAIYCICLIICILFFAKQYKHQFMKAISKGLWHGLLGVKGKCSQYTNEV